SPAAYTGSWALIPGRERSLGQLNTAYCPSASHEGAAVRPIWHLVPATDWACTPQPRRFAAPWWALIPRHLGSQRDAYPVGGRLRGGSGIDDSYPHLRHSREPQEPNASR